MKRWSTVCFLLIVAEVFSATIYAAGSEEVADASAAQVYEYNWATMNAHTRADDNYSKQWVEQKYNVTINFIQTDNQFEKLNVLMAAGDVPDLIAMRLNSQQLATYSNQGVLAEIPVDRIEKDMPDYYQYIESFDDPKLWKYGIVGGKHWGVPVPNWQGIYRRAITWRADWLLNVGINKIPSTLGEFETAFRAFRNDDPDRNGKQDTYALTSFGGSQTAPSGMFEEFFGAFGTFPFQWIDKNGSLIYGFTDEGVVDALKLLNRWYAEGILDPEFITQEGRTQGNDIAWKFATGRIGYISSLSGDDMVWDGGGHLNAKWLKEYPEHNELAYEEGFYGNRNYLLRNVLGLTEILPGAYPGVHPYVHGDPPTGPNGLAGMPVSGKSNTYIVFGRQLESNAGKLTRVLTILNDMASDKETYIKSSIGQEGFTWDWMEDPTGDTYAIWREDWLARPDRQNLAPHQIAGQAINPFWVVVRNQYFSYTAPVYKQRISTNENIAKSNTVELPLKVGLPSAARYADLDKILDEFFYKAILGEIGDIEAGWRQVVDTWNKNGGDVLTREANDWYTTVK